MVPPGHENGHAQEGRNESVKTEIYGSSLLFPGPIGLPSFIPCAFLKRKASLVRCENQVALYLRRRRKGHRDDFALIDWAAIYMRDVFAVPPFLSGFGWRSASVWPRKRRGQMSDAP